MASALKRISAPVDDDEFARINEQARSRGLSTSSFVRLVVTGAILRGGGTLDQLLVVGEAAGKVPIKSTIHRDFRNDWRSITFGVQVAKSDPSWVLRLPEHRSRRGATSRKLDPSDQSNWWVLTHPDLAEPVPMGWTIRDAAREATTYIEERSW